MIIHYGAMVLVADGEKYLLLRNTGTAVHPQLTYEGGGGQDNPATAQQGTDAPGRTLAGSGSARSAMDQTDFHQIAEDLFAAHIAGLLSRLAGAGDYDELIVVAPPRCLAELRGQFDAAVNDRVVAEISKDLTKHPVGEITEILSREE